MLGIILKFLLPFAAIYLVVRGFSGFFRQVGPPRGGSGPRSGGEVIDVCPKCGELDRRGHNCDT